jgi:hypothetical protein
MSSYPLTISANELCVESYTKYLLPQYNNVLTTRGWVNIEDLRPGDMVAGLNQGGKTIFVQVDEMTVEEHTLDVRKFESNTAAIELADIGEVYCAIDRTGTDLLCRQIKKDNLPLYLRKYSLNDYTDRKDITYKMVEDVIGKETGEYYELVHKLSYSQARVLLQKYMKNGEYMNKSPEMVNRVGVLSFMAGFNVVYRKKPQGFFIKMMNHGYAELKKEDMTIATYSGKIHKLVAKTPAIFVKRDGHCCWI